MKRLSSIFNFRHLPYAFIVALVFVFVSQQMFVHSADVWAYLYRNSSPKLDDALRFAAIANGVDKSRNKILILGASQARENIDAWSLSQMFKKEGVTFYNLGISQGQAIDFFMTKKLVLGTNPDSIIFIGDLNMFSSPYMFTKLRLYFNPDIMHYWIYDLGWRYVWRHREYILHSLIGYAFPAYRYRESIGKILRQELIIHILRKKRKPFHRYAYYDRKTSNEIYRKLEGRIHTKYAEKYVIARPAEKAMNEMLFETFIRDVNDAHIPIVTIDAPYFEDAKQTYFKSIYYDYDSFMRSLAEKYHYRYYSNLEVPHLAKEDFFDHTHLNAHGREDFTKFVASIVKQDFFSGISK